MKKFFLSTLITLAVAAPANAQWKVFDASNFIKQAITAAKSGESAETLLRQHQLQIDQYLLQFMNQLAAPQGLLDSALAREISEAAYGQTDRDALRAAGVQVRNVYADAAARAANDTRLYQQMANFGQDMNRFSAASGMSWDEILRYEKENNVAAHGVAVSHYQQAENLLRQLEANKNASERLTRNAVNAQGAMDALGSLALQNQLLTDQLSGLTAAAARKEVREAARFGREADEAEASRRAREEAAIRNKSVSDFFRGGQK